MRANAVKREPELQAFWSGHGIDGQMGLENKGPTFTLHDARHMPGTLTWGTP